MRNLGWLLILFWIRPALAQSVDTSLEHLASIPSDYASKVGSSLSRVEERLVNKSSKYLSQLSRQEQKLREKLFATDSNAAREIFDQAKGKYQQLQDRIKSSTGILNKYSKSYSPLLDSLRTSLNFLQNGNLSLLSNAKGAVQITDALEKINSLQSKLNQAEEIREFIRERREMLKQQLEKFGLLENLRKFNEKVFYYQAQLVEIKESLKEPDRLIAKSLQILQKIPAFVKFFNQHSELASLFRLPGAPMDPASLAGLQTRAAMQSLIQQRFGSGANTQQMLDQKIADTQSQLNKLKDKINQVGGSGNSEIDMPDFKPDLTRTKTFWQRLEYGTNFQTVRANGFFPTTTDIALSISYRISERNSAGISVAYKIGFGESFRNIHITHQGVGLRSFVDVKLKGSFYISGGAEMNYRNQIREFDQLKNYSAWQKSALMGITKRYSIGKKKGSIQVLFDFLYKNQIPKETPIKFRLGYYL